MKISKSEYFFLKFKLLKIRKLDCCKKKISVIGEAYPVST
ncbi:MAG: hypothetical protein ACI85O_002896, partial [Saprospiraceae bacterium]